MDRTHAFDLAMGAAIAAVAGHIFPVWLGFRGGKGVATALGVFLVLSPMLALCLLGVFIVVFALSRYVSLASILAAASVPLFALLFAGHMSHIVLFGFLFIPVQVIAKHHANIRRLLSGTESRFGGKK
jgi:glycerol-3-phosphate acyltransferase PlsY